jgi:ABC-2 type transport system ATP-binding protein
LEKRFEADLHKPIGSLSKGNRQKIGIIQALMHQPDVLILDEPTSGLDPLMQEVFYDYLRQARDRGVAVFMSSHNLTEAQRVCDRVGIIKHGKLIREQAIEGTATLDKPLFRLTLTYPTMLAKLKKARDLKFISAADGTVLMQATDSIQAALTSLSAFDLRDIRTEQLNLEDEFLEFYGDNDA